MSQRDCCCLIEALVLHFKFRANASSPRRSRYLRVSFHRLIMAVTTVLDYKVNETDLKAWLDANIGSANGVPLFTYTARHPNAPVENTSLNLCKCRQARKTLSSGQ